MTIHREPPAEAFPASAVPAALTAPLVIAMLTYKRPDDLAQALPPLLAQAARASLPAQVLVVDNDPDGGARTAVSDIGHPALVYIHEPRPGIAAARNRALAEASDSASLLVFIDDDEVPSQDWLQQLVDLQSASGAAAVVGPVISEYAQAPESWITAGAFFNRRRLPTGTRLSVAATNNLLLDLRQIRSLGLSFDERFGLSGGSDTLFTRQLAQSGAVMLWCDEATVVDRVPVSRLTRSWVLRRAFRSGNGHSRVRLATTPNRTRRVVLRIQLCGPALVRCAGGAVRCAAGTLTRSEVHQARGARTAARGAGMLTGAFGYIYSEYKRS